MKKLVLCLAAVILLFASPAFGVHLVSDPPAPCGEAGQLACPVSATIYEDGAMIAEDIALQPDLSILHDLVTMPVGEHVYTAIYKDELGRPSAPSDPCLLLTVVGKPSNMKLTP